MSSGLWSQGTYQSKLQNMFTAASDAATNIGRRTATYWNLQLQKLSPAGALNQHTFMMAIKASIPPTVLVCAIQSNTWISYFKTNAYLAPIISACALPTLPRARLIEYNFQLSLAFTLTYCWVLLAGWSGLQARKHTIGSLDKLQAYNSTAETVVALFFISSVWFIFTIKSAFPKIGLQCTLAGVLAVATLPRIATFTNMAKIVQETNNVFVAFLVGQAVGLVNALVLFPQNSMEVYRRDIACCLEGLIATIRAHQTCMEDINMNNPCAFENDEEKSPSGQLKSSVQAFINTVLRLRESSKHAAHEIIWGRYDSIQLKYIRTLLVGLVPPVLGLNSLAEMMHLAMHGHYPARPDVYEQNDLGIDRSSELKHQQEWHLFKESMHQHTITLCQSLIGGAEDAKIRLELPTGSASFHRDDASSFDEENQSSPEVVGRRISDLYRDRLNFSSTHGDDTFHHFIRRRPLAGGEGQVTLNQDYDNLRYLLLLHSETLLLALGVELRRLLTFVDDFHKIPKRLHIPYWGNFRKWAQKNLRQPKSRKGQAQPSSEIPMGVDIVSCLCHCKDPDHLPPTTLLQRIGNKVRKISRFFRTNHTAFGLRGTCAMMTIGIMAFLEKSQGFYNDQNLLWALFAILLSMNQTSGSSTFFFFGRVIGTIASMIMSYLIWYVVDCRTPGILILLWIWFIVLGFLFEKYPKFFSIWFVALVATIVMIASELQVRQLGEETASSLGQKVYAPYIIFPFRVAIVGLGVLVGYFWTIFPYPVSEHNEIRRNTAKCLLLLAELQMCSHEALMGQLQGVSDNFSNDDATNPLLRLQTTRRQILREFQILNNKTKTHLQYLGWEFSLGGRFPKKEYIEILSILERLSGNMTLASHVIAALKLAFRKSSWMTADQTQAELRFFAPEGVTTALVLLHSALRRAHQLPQLNNLDMPNFSEFLSRDVHADEGFAVAAIIHSVNWYIVRDINRLKQLVKQLVGEFDFSWHIAPAPDEAIVLI